MELALLLNYMLLVQNVLDYDVIITRALPARTSNIFRCNKHHVFLAHMNHSFRKVLIGNIYRDHGITYLIKDVL